MPRLTVSIIIIALFLTGCAAVMNQLSGRGVVSVQKSAIDESEVVTVSGNNVVGNAGMSSFDGALLGARWESITPETVYIDVSYTSSANDEPIVIEFDELRVNLDGTVSSFRPLAPGRINMPLAYLESMLRAGSCNLQLVRGSKVTDGDFAIAFDAGKPMAKASLQRFYDRVLEVKASRMSKQL
jgi:hypothetical protein